MNYLIGIDVGTSSTKTVLFDEKGEVIASASEGASPLYTPHNGWAEQENRKTGAMVRSRRSQKS